MAMSPHPRSFNLLSRKLFVFKEGLRRVCFVYLFSDNCFSLFLESFSSLCHVFVYVSCFVIRMEVNLLPLTTTLQSSRKRGRETFITHQRLLLCILCLCDQQSNEARKKSSRFFDVRLHNISIISPSRKYFCNQLEITRTIAFQQCRF